MDFRRLLIVLLAGLAVSPAALADRAVDASRYYEDALKRYARADDAGAIIQLKNALKADSRMLPALVLMGQSFLRTGDPAAAERVLADAERLGAARAQIATLQAQAYLMQGKYRLMLEKFGADGLPPAARLDMLLMRGRAQLSLSQLDAAMSSAGLAGRIPGGGARARALEARIHLNAERTREALAAVEDALRLAPRSAEALTMQASILHADGDLAGAIREYSRALKSDPAHLDARIARAGALLDLHRDDEARPDLDYLKRHNGYDPRGAYLRALYHSRRGEHEAARAALHEATRTLSRLAPEFLAATGQLQLLGGLAHHALGEFERAKSFLGPYQERHPRDVGVRKLLASIYLSSRQYDRVLTQLQPALRAAPDDAGILAMLGEVAMRQGKHDKAANLFREAAEASDSAEVQAGLGVSLIGAGQAEAGFRTLERAHAQRPEATQTAIPYALALLKRGDARAASNVVAAIVKREPRNVAMLNLLGITRLAMSDPAGARRAYVAAIKIAPGFHPAHLNLARVDEIDGQPARARARYLGLLKVAPAHVDAMLELSRLEASQGRSAEAVRWLDKARSVKGDDPRPLLALHELYLRQGQARQALDAARDAQALAPDHAPALHALAQAYVAVGNGERARSVLRRLTQVVAFNPERLTATAALQMRVGDVESARYALGKALLADPDYLPARVQQVRLELQNGRIDEAEKQAQALVGQPRSGAAPQRILGEIRMAQKRYGEAVAAYRAALEQEASEAGAFGLYDALRASGQVGAAAALMADWHVRQPKNRLVAHALAEAQMAQNQPARARDLYLGLVRTDPRDARAHNNLAHVLLLLRDGRALTHAQHAYALAPGQPQVNDTLGWVLVNQGQIDKGLRYLREAALRAPDNREIQAHLDATLARIAKR